MKKVTILFLLIFGTLNLTQAQWQQTNVPTTDDILSIGVNGTDIFAGTNGGGVYLSSDNGSSWTAVNTGLTNMEIYSFVFSGSNIFVSTYGGGVFLSSNNNI